MSEFAPRSSQSIGLQQSLGADKLAPIYIVVITRKPAAAEPNRARKPSAGSVILIVRQVSALARAGSQHYRWAMPTVNELEKLALGLPETDRAVLASTLLDSLSPILDDEDEGMAEALRRNEELEADPSLGMSLEQLDHRITQRRK